MKLATLSDIVHLKLDHQVGSFVNEASGKKVRLDSFRIVYVRYGKRLFEQARATGKWSVACSTGDAIVGTVQNGATDPCGTRSRCKGCKPTLYLGLVDDQGRMFALTLSATAATSMGDVVSVLSREPDPIFWKKMRVSLVKTEKQDLVYTQLSPRLVAGERISDPSRLLDLRSRLKPVIDQKADPRPAAGAPKPALTTLKM